MVYFADLLSRMLGYLSYKHEPEIDMHALLSSKQKEFLETNGFPATEDDINAFLKIIRNRLEMEGNSLFVIFPDR